MEGNHLSSCHFCERPISDSKNTKTAGSTVTYSCRLKQHRQRITLHPSLRVKVRVPPWTAGQRCWPADISSVHMRVALRCHGGEPTMTCWGTCCCAEVSWLHCTETRQSLSDYLPQQIMCCTVISFEPVPHGSCVVKIIPTIHVGRAPAFTWSFKLNTNTICLNDGSTSDNGCCEFFKNSTVQIYGQTLIQASRHAWMRYIKWIHYLLLNEDSICWLKVVKHHM